ncbi:unnamed protein product [Cylindrotheca closterium]|uniref:Uncharacterized protein n=1 Tax=Cylindrotheca closterium TaxID=2856 RepID=A0AAD2FX38_9STRA|nr:unnamed protein product [Cylindrotheca closterium]
MQGTTGFSYFVAFASVISVFMSFFFAVEFPVIVPYFENRNSPKTWCIQGLQAVLFVGLAGAVSFLTWSAIEGNFSILFEAIAILYICLFLFYVGFAHKDVPVIKSSFQKYAMQIGVVFYIIMLPGLVCFALSYRNQTLTAEYRKIDMHIQNSTVEFDGQYPCHDGNGGDCGAYKATFNVNWGHEWACPDHKDVWCDEWIVEPDCMVVVEESTTTLNDFTMYAAQVEQCVQETYGLPVMGQHLDTSKYPDLKDNWPEIPFLGSCSSRCSAKPLDTDMFLIAERIKLAGLVLSCSGAFLFFIYYSLIFGQDMKDVCTACSRQSKHLQHNFLPFRWMLHHRGVLGGGGGAVSNSTTSHERNSDSDDFSTHDSAADGSDSNGSHDGHDEEEGGGSRSDQEDGSSSSSSVEMEMDQTTRAPYNGPVMAKAEILYSSSDDEDDYDDDDDYSSDDDEESGSYHDSNDEMSSSSSQEDDDDSQKEEESSLASLDASSGSGSCCDGAGESLEDVELSAEPCGSYNNSQQEGEEQEEVGSLSSTGESRCNKSTSTVSKVEEVEIDV